MLNKKEIAVMRCVYELCKNNNDGCIVSDKVIIESSPEKYKLDVSSVDLMLKQLEYDGYFECTKSEKKGVIVNVITLKQKGKAFERELVQRRREVFSNFVWRMLFAALGAVGAFIVGKLLGG